jgi:hypothetical protein
MGWVFGPWRIPKFVDDQVLDVKCHCICIEPTHILLRTLDPIHKTISMLEKQSPYCAMDMGTWISLQHTDFYVFGVYPVVRSQNHIVVLFFIFLRNLCTVFYGCTNLCSQQQCAGAPFSPHPLAALGFFPFFIASKQSNV